MRVLSVGCVALLLSVGGCAMVSGLGDYQEMPAADKAALNSNPDASGDDVSSDTSTEDASTDSGESETSTVFDAGAFPDVDFDAPPPCGPATCTGGCCMNGTCVGGHSVNTCGTKGELCKDCTTMGNACTNGACTSVKVDAAPPPTCNYMKCGGCIPFYQTGCCKSDQTCGCEVSFSSDCK